MYFLLMKRMNVHAWTASRAQKEDFKPLEKRSEKKMEMRYNFLQGNNFLHYIKSVCEAPTKLMKVDHVSVSAVQGINNAWSVSNGTEDRYLHLLSKNVVKLFEGFDGRANMSMILQVKYLVRCPNMSRSFKMRWTRCLGIINKGWLYIPTPHVC